MAKTITTQMIEIFNRDNAKMYLDWLDQGADDDGICISADDLFFFLDKLEEVFPEYFEDDIATSTTLNGNAT